MSSTILGRAPRRFIAIVLALAAGGGAARADDPAAAAATTHGKRLFLYCAACHSLAAGEPDKVGPNLHGVIGAKAGTRGSFTYSSALKESGIVWTDDKLDAWLKDPNALIPGTKMAFAGMPKDQDRADLVAYLKDATK